MSLRVQNPTILPLAAAVSMLVLLVTGCAGSPDVTDSSLGRSSISILDGDADSRRYTLFLRRSDGAWFQGGGRAAFEGIASRPLEMTEADRTSILDAIRRAGWLEDVVQVEKGTGPRFIEVSMSGRGVTRTFSILATDGGFDPATEAVLAVLGEVSGRRFRGVLDALPQGRSSESSVVRP